MSARSESPERGGQWNVRRPYHVVGRFAPVQAVLRCDAGGVAVADRFQCFPKGVAFRLRHARPPSEPPWPLRGVLDCTLDVVGTDGRTAITDLPAARDDDDRPVLWRHDAGAPMTFAGPGCWAGEGHYWLRPLPEPGTITLRFEGGDWFPECAATVDTAVLRRCADQALAPVPDARARARAAELRAARPRGTMGEFLRRQQPMQRPLMAHRVSPPQALVASPVDLRAVLVHDAYGVMVVDGFEVYPDAVLFNLIILRPDAPYGLLELDAWELRAAGRADRGPRLRVVQSDGRAATSVLFEASHPDGVDDPPPVLRPTTLGGAAYGQFNKQGYVLSPLPPPGPLTFEIAWPDIGLAPTQATIPAEPLIDAASRALRMWQDPPPGPTPPAEP